MMEVINENLLTILILLPTFGALGVLAYQMFSNNEGHLKWLTLAITIVNFLLSLLLIGGTRTTGTVFSFEQNIPWISAINTNYHVGVDGLSLWLVILTTLIMPISVLSTWYAVEKRPTAFYMFLLLLESAMIGVFVSLDLLVFYLFFEASLVPMFFLIGIWGGENRIYAAIKFFIFTALGSLLMLAAIIALYYIHADATGYGTFDFVTLLHSLEAGRLVFAPQTGMLLFLAFALAFSIKVPLFPFHTWLPDAHTEAPTAGSVILAAILLKMGTYGLMRFNFTLFPGGKPRARVGVHNPRDHRHHLWRARCDGPAGYETPGGVFIGRTHGLCHPRNVLVHRIGNAGSTLPDAQSRRFDRSVVPACRVHL